MAGCRDHRRGGSRILVLCLVMNLSRRSPLRAGVVLLGGRLSWRPLLFQTSVRCRRSAARGRLSRLGCRPVGSSALRALFDLCHFRVEAVALIVVALIRRAEATCAILDS